MKTCSRCRLERPLTDFARSSSSRDRRQHYCRACKAAWAKAKYHADITAARARVRDSLARQRAARPEWFREYARQWRAANPERARAKLAAQRAKPEHKAWQAAYWKEWKRRNPEQTRLIARRGQQARRARKQAAFVEHVDALLVLEFGNGICGICNEPVDPADFHVDHIVPLARGGEHSYANTQPAHPFCNVSKGARLPEQVAA